MTRIGRLPVTNPSRTLLDLGSVADADVVERAMESALRVRKTSLPELEELVDGRGGRRGGSVLRQVLARRPSGTAPTESDAETLFVQLCRRHGFEEPQRQYRLLLGGRPIRVDFAWPGVRLAVEVDGGQVHGNPSALGSGSQAAKPSCP